MFGFEFQWKKMCNNNLIDLAINALHMLEKKWLIEYRIPELLCNKFLNYVVNNQTIIIYLYRILFYGELNLKLDSSKQKKITFFLVGI